MATPLPSPTAMALFTFMLKKSFSRATASGFVCRMTWVSSSKMVLRRAAVWDFGLVIMHPWVTRWD